MCIRDRPHIPSTPGHPFYFCFTSMRFYFTFSYYFSKIIEPTLSHVTSFLYDFCLLSFCDEDVHNWLIAIRGHSHCPIAYPLLRESLVYGPRRGASIKPLDSLSYTCYYVLLVRTLAFEVTFISLKYLVYHSR